MMPALAGPIARGYASGLAMRFSIVTCSFNSAETIGDTLRSVDAQDWPDIEHIIVDGASRDGTVALVERASRSWRSCVSERDGGIYDAMNKGLARATGDYVIFLNSDDFFCRSDAVSLFATHAGASADFLLADTQFVKRDGSTPHPRLYSARRFQPWWLRFGVMPPHPSMAVRRTVLLELGGFDPGYRIAGDFDLIARGILASKRNWKIIAAVTTSFRVGGVSTSGWRSKRDVGREMARSLRRQGRMFPVVSVQLRYLLKLPQLIFGQPRRAKK